MRFDELEFQPRRRAGALGWLLLLAGATSLALVVSFQMEATASLERVKTGLRDQQARHSEARVPAASEAELVAARRVVEALNRPWEALFSELEQADTADIALLSLRPDSTARELRISAEARDVAAMLNYHRWLGARPQLADVALVRHEQLGQGAQRALRFDLRAAWRP